MKYKRAMICWSLGAGLLFIAAWIPGSWFVAQPAGALRGGIPTGETLLRLSLILEALVLLWLAMPKSTPGRLGEADRIPVLFTDREEKNLRSRGWILGAITLFALILRLYHLDADLWLDEIITVIRHCPRSVWELLTVYPGSNNHLLNTLLVKAGITWFGEQEWAIRLPAVIFGTATIPTCYWLARMAMSSRASLAAALLLAVSYHHLFYSQNARGYSAYLLFSMISTGLLIRGMQEDRARSWLLYIACMVLNFASLLISGYVFAAHILLGVGTLVWMKRQGKRTQPMMRRLTCVFFATGLLVFQLYSVVLPQAYRVIQTTWTQRSSGFLLFSLDFVRELARGLSAGFGPIFMVAALPALLIGGAGIFGLFRRHWLLTLALILPGILNALFLLANRLTIAPRFLILALPLVLLASLRGLEMAGSLTARWFGSHRARFAAWFLNLTVALMCAGSLLSLRSYYAAPKQDFRSAIRYLQGETGPEDLIIVLDLAEAGFRYYGSRTGFTAGKDYYVADSLQALDELLSAHPGKRTLLATTLFYLFEIDHPEMADRIRKGWTPLRDFPGTLGGGSIRIWVNYGDRLLNLEISPKFRG